MIECKDVLAHVGQPVELTARLGLRHVFRMGFPLTGKVIRFLVDGEEIGRAKTTRRGLASVSFTPFREKEYHVVAACEGPGLSRSAFAEATVFSRSKKRKGIVLDMDRTLSEGSMLRWIIAGNKRIPPLDHAVEVARALAREYDLIVITGRKTYLRRRTRRWLAEKGFPRAPIFFSSFIESPWGQEQFKTKLIRELKEEWENIAVGIGDRDSDARAYRANGLKAILIRQRGACPRGAITVPGWESIRELLLG
jgi:hypothetical protein